MKVRPTEISITSAIILLVEILVPAVVLHHPSVDGQESEDDPSARHFRTLACISTFAALRVQDDFYP